MSFDLKVREKEMFKSIISTPIHAIPVWLCKSRLYKNDLRSFIMNIYGLNICSKIKVDNSYSSHTRLVKSSGKCNW